MDVEKGEHRPDLDAREKTSEPLSAWVFGPVLEPRKVPLRLSLDFLFPVSYNPGKSLQRLLSLSCCPDFAKHRAFSKGVETDITEKLSIRSSSQAA
jgi:hypothetical protein